MNTEPAPFRQSVQGEDPTILQKYIHPPEGYSGIAIRQLIQRNVDHSWSFRRIIARISQEDLIINAARGADVDCATKILPPKCIQNIQDQSQKLLIFLVA